MYQLTHFDAIRKEFEEFDTQREELIKKSRDVLKLSKLVIYAVHRDDLVPAKKLVQEMERERQKLEAIAKHNQTLLMEGSYKVALQEYAEALLYYTLLTEETLLSPATLKIKSTFYILGLCDLTGELVRKAVFLAGKSQTKEVIKIKEVVDFIYGELLRFNFRDNEIRHKFDAVKYDLKKLEDLVLELKLKGR